MASRPKKTLPQVLFVLLDSHIFTERRQVCAFILKYPAFFNFIKVQRLSFISTDTKSKEVLKV